MFIIDNKEWNISIKRCRKTKGQNLEDGENRHSREKLPNETEIEQSSII